MIHRYHLKTAAGEFVTQTFTTPELTKAEARAYCFENATEAARMLVAYEKALGVPLTIHGPDAREIINATNGARMNEVQWAPLAELPALYQRFIGYNPTEDDHSEQPSETMRATLLEYLAECFIEDDANAIEEKVRAAAAKPEALTLDTPNLEACEDEELEAWRKAFSDLALICAYLQEARDLRRSGLVSNAQPLEAFADQLHRCLPDGIRW